MPQVAQLAQQIAQLSARERSELLNRLAQQEVDLVGAEQPPDSIPGIVKSPDVCGGAARVKGTRIPVWTLQRMQQLGLCEADI